MEDKTVPNKDELSKLLRHLCKGWSFKELRSIFDLVLEQHSNETSKDGEPSRNIATGTLFTHPPESRSLHDDDGSVGLSIRSDLVFGHTDLEYPTTDTEEWQTCFDTSSSDCDTSLSDCLSQFFVMPDKVVDRFLPKSTDVGKVYVDNLVAECNFFLGSAFLEPKVIETFSLRYSRTSEDIPLTKLKNSAVQNEQLDLAKFENLQFVPWDRALSWLREKVRIGKKFSKYLTEFPNGHYVIRKKLPSKEGKKVQKSGKQDRHRRTDGDDNSRGGSAKKDAGNGSSASGGQANQANQGDKSTSTGGVKGDAEQDNCNSDQHRISGNEDSSSEDSSSQGSDEEGVDADSESDSSDESTDSSRKRARQHESDDNARKSKYLMSLIANENGAHRQQALFAVSKFVRNNTARQDAVRDAKGLSLIMSLLFHEDLEIILAAVVALKALIISNAINKEIIRRKKGIRALVAILNDDEKEKEVCKHAILTIGVLCLKHPPSQDALREAKGNERLVSLLRSSDKSIRVLSAAALGVSAWRHHANQVHVEKAGGLKHFIPLLSDTDPVCLKLVLDAVVHLVHLNPTSQRAVKDAGVVQRIELLCKASSSDIKNIARNALLSLVTDVAGGSVSDPAKVKEFIKVENSDTTPLNVAKPILQDGQAKPKVSYTHVAAAISVRLKSNHRARILWDREQVAFADAYQEAKTILAIEATTQEILKERISIVEIEPNNSLPEEGAIEYLKPKEGYRILFSSGTSDMLGYCAEDETTNNYQLMLLMLDDLPTEAAVDQLSFWIAGKLMGLASRLIMSEDLDEVWQDMGNVPFPVSFSSSRLDDEVDREIYEICSRKRWFVYEIVISSDVKVAVVANLSQHEHVPTQPQIAFVVTRTSTQKVLQEDPPETESEEVNLVELVLVKGDSEVAKKEVPAPLDYTQLCIAFQEQFNGIPSATNLKIEVETGGNSPLKEYITSSHDFVNYATATKFIYSLDESPLHVRESASMSGLRQAFHISQSAVATKLFSRTVEVLSRSRENYNLQDDFDSFKFLVMVPKFNTLKQQTMDRLREIEDLVGTSNPDAAVEEVTMLYPLNCDLSKSKMRQLEIEIRENPRMLFVLVVDESHYSPTINAIPLLHSSHMKAAHNFVAVLISATPYNCLSSLSQISEDNRLEWSNVVSRLPEKTMYVGFEYYARSIAFRCPQSDMDFVFRVICTGEETKTYSVPLQLGSGEFAGFAGLFAKINEVLTSPGTEASRLSGVKLIWDRKRRSALLNYKPKDVQFVAVGVLAKLGFVDADFSGADAKAAGCFKATGRVTVDEGYPVHNQHLRDDSYFTSLREVLERRFPYLRKTVTKKETALPSLRDVGVHKLLLPFVSLYDPQFVGKTAITARNGFIVVVDYIFSLAYFASRKLVVGSVDVDTYLRCLAQSSYFCDDKNYCNLLPMVSAVLEKMIEERMSDKDFERSGAGSTDDTVLKSILQEKLSAEKDAYRATDTETWYTETDRIIKPLLGDMGSSKPMVLLRVYDNDENLSMQRILRHALRTCFPSVKGDYKPRFSILGDISNTNIYQAIEDHFKTCTIDHEVYGRCTLAEVREKKSGTIKAEVTYEDLAGIPCLVILCEKGRMGDTYPPNLRVLDMRVRTGQSGSTVIQELGRMCRYVSVSKVLKSLVLTIEDASSFDDPAIQATLLPNGAAVYVESSNTYLGVVETIESLRHIWYSLDQCNVRLKLCPLSHPLPTALLGSDTLEVIRKGVEAREAYICSLLSSSPTAGSICAAASECSIPVMQLEQSRDKHRILPFLKFSKLDSYLNSSRALSVRDTSAFKLAKRQDHYDLHVSPENQYHDRRLLLMAECQIGKTGSYLAYLQLLDHHINKEDESLPITAPMVREGIQLHEWFVPYWHSLHRQPALDYSAPQSGKYILPIARQRLALLRSAVVDSQEDDEPSRGGALSSPRILDTYCRKLMEYEYTSSMVGFDLWNALTKKAFTNEEGLLSNLANLLNWDGRLSKPLRDDKDGNSALDLVLREYESSKVRQHSIGSDQAGIDRTVRLIWERAITDHATSNPSDESSDNDIGPHGSMVMFKPKLDVARQFHHNPRSLGTAVPDDFSLPNPMTGNTFELEIELADKDVFGERIAYTFHGSYRVHFPANALRHLDLTAMHKLESNEMKLRSLCSLLNQELLRAGSSSSDNKVIRYWIFTPSFTGRSTITEKFLYRRSCFPNLEPFRGYVQVLVVRAEQFNDYRSYFGQEYIILSLPPEMHCVDKRGSTETAFTFTPESAGCGYSRLFIQRFASLQQLTAVWMIDDNVNACYQLDGLDQPDNSKKSFTNACFQAVMHHMESALDSSNASGHSSDIIGPLEEELLQGAKYGKMPRHGRESEALLRNKRFSWSEMEFGNAETIPEYAPAGSQIGIIGCGRCAMLRNESIAEPIKVTHSVYSFFLFNVAAATKHDLYYPPRRTMEDIEMSFMMEEAGLVVCKLQAFSHSKPVRALANQPKGFPTILEHLLRLNLPQPTAYYHHGESRDNLLMLKMVNSLVRKQKYRLWEGEREDELDDPAQSLVVLMHQPVTKLYLKRGSFIGSAYGALCRLSSSSFEALLDPSCVVYVHGSEELKQVAAAGIVEEALEGLTVVDDQGLMLISSRSSASMRSTSDDGSAGDKGLLPGPLTPGSRRQSSGVPSPQKATGQKRRRDSATTTAMKEEKQVKKEKQASEQKKRLWESSPNVVTQRLDEEEDDGDDVVAEARSAITSKKVSPQSTVGQKRKQDETLVREEGDDQEESESHSNGEEENEALFSPVPAAKRARTHSSKLVRIEACR